MERERENTYTGEVPRNQRSLIEDCICDASRVEIVV